MMLHLRQSEEARGGYFRSQQAPRQAMDRKTTYSIVMSSTYTELVEHRRAVREAMLGQQLLPVAMEDDSAVPDQDLIAASLAKVDEADAYIGLISYRYGQIPESSNRNPNGLSLTELEFLRAVARGIPICMFIMHQDHLVPRSAVGEERGTERKLESFLSLAKKDRIYAEFKSVEDLKTKAVQSLVKLREALDKRTPARATAVSRASRWNLPLSVAGRLSEGALEDTPGTKDLGELIWANATAFTLDVLGQMFRSNGNLRGAKWFYERALTIREKALGATHHSTTESARVTAATLDALGRADEAAAVRVKYSLDSTPSA